MILYYQISKVKYENIIEQKYLSVTLEWHENISKVKWTLFEINLKLRAHTIWGEGVCLHYIKWMTIDKEFVKK